MAVLQEVTDSGGTIIRWKHLPAYYMAPDMDIAIRQADIDIWKTFPLAEGYSQHHLTVEVVPKSFFDGMNAYISGGLFTTENDLSETLREVYLTAPVTADFENDPTRDIH